MSVSSVPARLGAISALGAGAATATALVLLDSSAASNTQVDRLPALAAAAGGALLLLGGGVGARAAERSLRPGLALAGRTSAALGAALVSGAIVGTVGIQLNRMLDGRSRMSRSAEELAVQQGRAAKAPSAEAETKDLEATRDLAAEYAPAAAGSAPRLPAGDPRVDIGDAAIADVAGALHRAYDTNDSSVLWLPEQQRVRDGRTLSISTIFKHAPVHDGARQFNNPNELEAIIAAQVDRREGRRGVIDADEVAAWYASGGVGEKDITWPGETSFTTDLFGTKAVQAADVAWSIGPYSAKTGPILYLVDVHGETAAREALRSIVRDDLPSPVLVRLPDGAPSEYGVVSLLRGGKRSADRPDESVMPQLREGLGVASIANKQGVF